LAHPKADRNVEKLIEFWKAQAFSTTRRANRRVAVLLISNAQFGQEVIMPEHSATKLFTYWVSATQTDIVRYIVFSVGLWFLLWVVLAKLLKNVKVRPDKPPFRQMMMEFCFSIRSVAVFSTVSLSLVAFEELGWFTGPTIGASLGPIWAIATFIGMVIGHDAWFYWSHRIMHDRRFFKMFHRRHHMSNNPSPFTAYSFDVGEAAVQALFVVTWALVVPTAWEVVGLYVLFQVARNSIAHCGYELFPATKDGRPMFDWLTTVTHHDLHHARAGYNYGFYFTFWDRVMGTEDPTYHEAFARVVRQREAGNIAPSAA
jgi:sterol desaturase/sphingolipid hydroxylase (fatty acid hydroxylase superfamily)